MRKRRYFGIFWSSFASKTSLFLEHHTNMSHEMILSVLFFGLKNCGESAAEYFIVLSGLLDPL